MISFEDGARITGSGFVVYRGAGARLERALINFLLNTPVSYTHLDVYKRQM